MAAAALHHAGRVHGLVAAATVVLLEGGHWRSTTCDSVIFSCGVRHQLSKYEDLNFVDVNLNVSNENTWTCNYNWGPNYLDMVIKTQNA